MTLSVLRDRKKEDTPAITSTTNETTRDSTGCKVEDDGEGSPKIQTQLNWSYQYQLTTTYPDETRID
jgi:hypothetical protein